ncbi:MAG TPA: PIG-L family deacetylase [Patescibacteria group bacterium]|nr:PIG-L family deacetylase [Patescibacteria group bacterium]
MNLDLKKQTLLVISPHPDDEVLGCGGLIKRVKDEGGKVYVLFVTVGETKEYASHGTTNGDQRVAEIEKVAKFLRYDDYKVVFPGNTFHLRLDNIPQKDLITEIEDGESISLNKIKPTIIATPQPQDYNQDHRACAQAVFAATRPAPNAIKPFQPVVLGFESVVTADWTSQYTRNPNFFVALSAKQLDTKLQALKLYHSQVREGSHPRSLQSLRNVAQFRGQQCGLNAAEAFFSYRVCI